MRPARVAVAVAVLVGMLLASSVAYAAFRGSTSATQAVSTDRLAAPTNPALSPGTCTVGIADSIVVSWTKTTSTWADGYEVLAGLLPGGPYTVTKLVSGRDTQSTTISGLSFVTSYYVVIKATKGNWRSAPSTEVSRTTRSALCA